MRRTLIVRQLWRCLVPGARWVPPNLLVTANAFLFAFASVMLLQALTRYRGAGPDSLVMFGVALVFTFNALVAMLQFLASPDALQYLVFWGMGSLTRAGWDGIAILGAVTLLTVPLSMRATWRLTALRLGEDRARSFGVDVARLRFASLMRVSLLAATSVAFVGTIGFIGLVGPHIARLLIGEDHRFFLPPPARGIAVIEIADKAEEQPIDIKGDFELRWLHRDAAPTGEPSLLADAVRAIDLPPDASSVFVWAGCEFSTFWAIRACFRHERALKTDESLIISYWRHGSTDPDGARDDSGSEPDQTWL